MGRKFLGSVMFLGVAVILYEIAGRLALEQRAGWGWFLIAGLIVTTFALNLWSEEVPTTQCPRCPKPYSSHDLE